MREACIPAWLNDARRYSSLIGEESVQPVSVFDMTGCDETSSESPGRLRLRLEPRFRYSPRLRVLDADGREEGVIHSDALVPGMRYSMHRNDTHIWILSVRSIVRKHHALALADGDSWMFDTPFFWWQHLTGTALGVPRLLGGLGPSWSIWNMVVEPGRDTFELLAAVAFMHRQWSHM
jgi:hypothetical protein